MHCRANQLQDQGVFLVTLFGEADTDAVSRALPPQRLGGVPCLIASDGRRWDCGAASGLLAMLDGTRASACIYLRSSLLPSGRLRSHLTVWGCPRALPCLRLAENGCAAPSTCRLRFHAFHKPFLFPGASPPFFSPASFRGRPIGQPRRRCCGGLGLGARAAWLVPLLGGRGPQPA